MIITVIIIISSFLEDTNKFLLSRNTW